MKELCTTSPNSKMSFCRSLLNQGRRREIFRVHQCRLSGGRPLHEVTPITHHVAGPDWSAHLDKAGRQWMHTFFPFHEELPMG